MSMLPRSIWEGQGQLPDEQERALKVERETEEDRELQRTLGSPCKAPNRKLEKGGSKDGMCYPKKGTLRRRELIKMSVRSEVQGMPLRSWSSEERKEILGTGSKAYKSQH